MTTHNEAQEVSPLYLYKIISSQDWQESQKKNLVKLSEADRDFIHLSKEDQLDRIIEKYWSDSDEFVILKITTRKLPGRLIFEVNPGGTNKYYHLYDGAIPLDAVVESKTIKRF